MSNQSKERNSSIELLRIISMIMILSYHFISREFCKHLLYFISHPSVFNQSAYYFG